MPEHPPPASSQNRPPAEDHVAVVHRLACYTFPWDMTRSLELALFRTFASPAIAGLLDRTGEFGKRAQKRYDDTDIIVSELLEWGYDSERGRAALARMNRIHGRFAIGNEEFLYVLSTFVLEPIRWIDRYGWRPLSGPEKDALFEFWQQVGRRMGIRDIPADLEALSRYGRGYEERHFRFAPENARVGAATLELFCGWFPRWGRPLVRESILALLDRELVDAFGFRPPSPALRATVRAALQLRARCLRWLPARRRPRLRTEGFHRSYPDGYSIEELGPS